MVSRGLAISYRIASGTPVVWSVISERYSKQKAPGEVYSFTNRFDANVFKLADNT